MNRITQIMLASALAVLLTAVPAMGSEGHGQEAMTEDQHGDEPATDQDHGREAMSDEDHDGGAQAAKGELEALRAELAELRARVKLLEPSLTRLMPNFAERFHVMHRAGDGGDWAVAQHELLAMRSIIDLAKRVEPEKGQMLEGFMHQPFADLDTAIEHEDREAFNKTLGQTIKNCNACHEAVGSPFVQVVLDARNSLSMRHPHRLRDSEPMQGHAH